MIQPPMHGEDVEELWRTVVEVVDVVNALLHNIEIRINPKSNVGVVVDGPGAGGKVDMEAPLKSARASFSGGRLVIVFE